MGRLLTILICLLCWGVPAATIQVAHNSQGATQSIAWASTQANWGADTKDRTPVMVFDGDSLIYGVPNPGKGIDYWLTNNYGAQIPGVLVTTNAGLAGVLVEDSLVRYPTNISSRWKPASGAAGFYLNNPGVNNLQGATTFAQVTNFYNSLTNIWGLARVDGFTVIACTIFRGSNIFDATEITLLERFNELITNSVAPKWDLLVDWDHIPGITNHTHDGLHLTTNGYRIVADLLFTNIFAGTDHIGPGDIAMLNGTITNVLTVGTNGTVANPIEIQFSATGAVMSKPYWPSTGAINLGGFNYITVNGNRTGLIENTDNGTLLGNQADSTGIYGSANTGTSIKNLRITNMYVRPYGSADGTRQGYPIKLLDTKDALIQSNWLHEGDTMLAMTWTTGSYSNWTILGNTIGRCNHGMSLGTATAGAYLYNVNVSSNRMDDFDKWDGNEALHLDGIILFIESPGPGYDGMVSNLTFAANHIGPNIGTINTAAIFIDTYQDWQIAHLRVVNNLFTSAAGLGWNNGFVTFSRGTNGLIANNTFYALGSPAGIGYQGGGHGHLTNNIFYSIGTAISLGPVSSVPTDFISDYNVFYNLPVGSGTFFHPNYSAGTITSWRGLGFDINSSEGQPLLDANYVPTASDTVAKSIGRDLSGFFTTDNNSVTRIEWYAGAFESQNLISGTVPAFVGPGRGVYISSRP